jgi:hypothetical protein
MMNHSLRNPGNAIRIVIALVGLLATASLPLSAKCVESQGNRGLEGHWVVKILAPDGSQFTNLLTFSQNGDVEIFANYRQTQSIGRGTYCKSGNREFTLTIVQLGYNAKLVQNELATVHSTIVLNAKGDQFTGPNNVQVVDPATGTVFFNGNGGTVVGQLVQPEDQ